MTPPHLREETLGRTTQAAVSLPLRRLTVAELAAAAQRRASRGCVHTGAPHSFSAWPALDFPRLNAYKYPDEQASRRRHFSGSPPATIDAG